MDLNPKREHAERVTAGEEWFLTARTLWVLLLIAVLAGMLLRFYKIDADSFWLDETWNLALANGHDPWAPANGFPRKVTVYRQAVTLDRNYYSQHLLSLLKKDPHPPLYYFSLNLWMHLFGTSEASLRSLSLLASVGCIPLVYFLGRSLFSSEAGIYAAFFFAFAPFQIAHSQEAKPYILMLFLTAASTLLAVRLCEDKKGYSWLMAHGIVVLLGLFTHYHFLSNLAFQSVLIVFFHYRNRAFLLRWGLIQALVLGIFLIFWLPILHAQIGVFSDRNLVVPSLSGAFTLPTSLLWVGRNLVIFLTIGRIEGLCRTDEFGDRCFFDLLLTVFFYTVPILLIAWCGWQCLFYIRGRSSGESRSRIGLAVCFLWGLSVVVGLLVLDAILDLHTVRGPKYMISASVPLYLILAAVLNFSLVKRTRLLVFLIVLFFLLGGNILYFSGLTKTKFGQGFREAAEHLEQEAFSEDLILVWNPVPNLLSLAYYLKSNQNLAGVVATNDITTSLESLDSFPQRVWFLAPKVPPAEAHYQNLVLEELRTRFEPIETKIFNNLDLFTFARRTKS